MVAEADRTVAVWTKTEPPAVREWLPRPALVADLRTAADRRLAVVSAPAGWGKSTLLADWNAADPRRFAWLALDDADNDPPRFWTYVVQALRRIHPDVGTAALTLLASPGVDIRRHVLPALLNELAGWEQDAVLVLDDYHAIVDPDIDDALGWFVEHTPPGFQLALVGRARPGLPLARLRARGQLVELDAGALAFSPAEAEELVNGMHGLRLDGAAVERLCERTEGWAAGLYLAVLSMRGRPGTHAEDFVNGFAGTDALVVELLHSEVLAGHPDAELRFLRRTAILPRLCAPLCDVVTGDAGSAAMLTGLERSNMFLTPLDTRGTWFRYHHLFADVLRAELERSEPDLVGELHRRAAGWFAGAGEVTDALHHLVAAGDLAEAGELVARSWSPHVQTGRDATVASWLRLLGEPTVRADARLCVAAATTALSLHRDAEAAGWIEAIERSEPAGAFHDGFSSAAAAAATTRAIRCMTHGDADATLAAAAEAARRERPGSPWHAVAVDVGGIALRWSGRPAEAERQLSRAVAASRDAGEQVMPVVYGLAHLAGIEADRHGWAAADRRAVEALREAERSGIREHWVCGMAHLVRGRVLAEAGRPAEAVPELRRGIELAERGAGPLDVAWGLLAFATAADALGDRPRAAGALAKARTTLAACSDPGPLLGGLLAATARRIGTGSRSGPVADGLSDREREIVALLATDLSQREIGERLHLSVNTVKSHVARIYAKLGVSTRADAVAAAQVR